MTLERDKNLRAQAAAAANLNKKEKKYWQEKLSGPLPRGGFPYDYKNTEPGLHREQAAFDFSPALSAKLMAIKSRTDYTLHLYLAACLTLLLYKYCHHDDIILGTPIYKQELEGEFLNTVLPLRNRLEPGMTFKELLFQVRQTISEAVEHQNYPVELLARQKESTGSTGDEHGNPLFETTICLENIHDPKYLGHITTPVQFFFMRTGNTVQARVEYDAQRYEPVTIQRIYGHFMHLLDQVLTDVNRELSGIDILLPHEKEQLLVQFNHSRTACPADRPIHELFEQQVEQTPDRTALVSSDLFITYRELNQRSNQLAHRLISRGAAPTGMVGLMVERSPGMITAILAVLKTGSSYLPIDPDTPQNRIVSMLEDSRVSLLVSDSGSINGHGFSVLQGLRKGKTAPILTAERPQVKELNNLPIPDRSLVDYEKYNQFIGLAAVKNSITMQATRGCPYKCAYCHKIWPKTHVVRSAEHIFAEVKGLYDLGIRRFSLIDDIFNLNVKNSTRFFQLIIDNGLDLQLFFPNGMRGDLLTRDYIDLMVHAGTINISLSLETASPRLQKLIGKNLNIEKLFDNLRYLCETYPGVILDVQTMHGFPTESEDEARQTLEFIKRLKWLHFPYVHVLKIYPNTDMEKLAIARGIPAEVIDRAADQAYHELSETIPFDKHFTLSFQSEFLNDYFLDKERLLHVLPYQLKVLTEDEMVQKYNAYLAKDIRCFNDLLELTGITPRELGVHEFLPDDHMLVPRLNEKLGTYFPGHTASANALRVLLLDLSTFFSHHVDVFYDMIEPPLGPMYLLTYLNQQLGNRVKGKILKSRLDFDNYQQLKARLEEFKPHVIGVRALTYYKNFFHHTIAVIRSLGFDGPIIAGGPYATSDCNTVLQDRNINLVVRGEGEVTFCHLIRRIIENKGKLPGEAVLKNIPGIAFIPGQAVPAPNHFTAREILLLDEPEEVLAGQPKNNPGNRGHSSPGFAYNIYTSGSTGTPKGTLVTHANVTQLVKNTNYIDFIPDHRVLQLSNYAFDGSVFDIYGALLNGASLVLMNREQLLEVDRLLALIEKQCIDVFFVTTALFNTLVDIGLQQLKHVKKILFGGERVSLEHTKKAQEFLGKGRILHMYGPTETTVYATYYPLDNLDPRLGTIPIGTPLANTTVYILDPGQALVPIGAAGELYIGGDGVARGYLNNPELTSERFLPLSPGFYRSNRSYIPQRIYRTGDLARWLWNGEIEFLERKDKQVKLRGFRIELGEIETHLSKHPEIREALVMMREDENSDKYLCAYIVTTGALEIASLKDYLSRDLPGFMIPAYFIMLPRMPLTPNGKIDTAALPAPQRQRESHNTDTSGLLEKQLAKIWSKVLGIDEPGIGPDDDFFELGGHSLKTTVLLSMIHKELKVKVPVREVFKTPTIRALAQYINRASPDSYHYINPVEKKEYYPLSPAQKRLYIVQQLDENSVGYNMPTMFILGGDIREEKLVGTFKTLVKRQESFRTAFVAVDEEPVQKVHDKVNFEAESYKASPGPHESTLEKFIRPFDLSQAPLLRVGLINPGKNQYLLMIDMHHIISDGTSIGILVKEFTALYSGETPPEISLYYKDFSEWYRNRYGPGLETMRTQEEYWLKEYTGEIPVLNLPCDSPRPPLQNFSGDVCSFEIGPEETRDLNRLAAAENATLFMALLAAANVLLSKLSGQEAIIIGSPVACRTHTALREIIGMFINTLPMKNFPVGNKTFREFLLEVKNRTVSALENQDYPLEHLVEKVMHERDASRNPLFDVMFALHNVEIPPVTLPEITLKPYPFRDKISKFDLNWEGVESEGKISFTLEYSTCLFKEDTARRFIRYFKRIISVILENPDITLHQVQIMDEAEKKQVLDMCTGLTGPIEAEETLNGWFEAGLEENTAAAALIYQDHTITYRQLNRKANQLAARLREKGAGPDQVVGLLIPRSIEMIIALLAVIKAGSAYLPIDPRYPDQRKQYMLEDSRVKMLLTNTRLEDRLSFIPGHIEIINIDDPHLFQGEGKNLLCLNTGANLVYVIYTSGSTGKPKGVMLENRSLVNLLFYQFKHTLIDCSSVLQFATIGFDASTHEIFSALLQVGRLVVIDEEDRTDIPGLFSIIAKNDVKTVFFPISFIKTIFNEETYAAAFPSSVKHIQSAGEQVVIPERFRAYLKENHTFLHNHYGPAETHVVTTLTLSPQKYPPEFPPIGKPILNTAIYILDKNKNTQPIGIPGELCIGGLQVGRGYLNNPQLTAERFCLRRPGGRFLKKLPPWTPRKNFSLGEIFPAQKAYYKSYYQTGDLARWLPDGNIEFLGRIDHQVKIRGFRVEPGEIENRLRQLPTVNEAVVIDREYANGEVYLCAYLETRGEIVPRELRYQLSRILPDYMIPACFVPMEKIPLNPSGKVNRQALPSPAAGESGKNLLPPRDHLQKKLAELWSEVLEVEKQRIGLDTNFFELGGHSLKATILTLKIQKTFGVKVSLADIFRSRSLRALAEHLGKLAFTGFTPLAPREEKDYYPLSPAQRRLYFLHQVIADSTAYNLGHIFILEGNPEKNHLEQIFAQLIKRHESLRTWFPRPGGQPVQRIHRQLVFNLCHYTTPREDPGPIIEDFIKPFDLNRAPLLRVCLARLSNHGYLFMFDMHHIISDGISMQVLAREFMDLYSQRRLSPLEIQYKDYSQWQAQLLQTGKIKTMETFWLKTFSPPGPPLNLPLDYQRPLEPDISGDQVAFHLSREETDALKQLAAANQTTLFMVLLSLYNILLARVCGQETVTVGTAVAGRPHHDLQNIIGIFVNTVALRNNPANHKSFRHFLQELKENTMKAFENQDYQFEILVDKVEQNQNPQYNNREALRNPLFDVAFGFQDIHMPPLQMPGLTLKPYNPKNRISKFDLTLYGTDAGQQLHFILEYRTRLFKQATIRRLAGYTREIAAAVTENPGILLKDITLTHDFVDLELKVPQLEDDDFGF